MLENPFPIAGTEIFWGLLFSSIHLYNFILLLCLLCIRRTSLFSQECKQEWGNYKGGIGQLLFFFYQLAGDTGWPKMVKG